MFLTSGVLHFVRPEVYEGIVPRWLPDPRGLVYLSGVAELACAGGLLHPRSRRAAGYASAALLVAVFPANVQMALDARHAAAGGGRLTAYQLATYARLPLQVPLIWVALHAAGWRAARKRRRDPVSRPIP